MLIKKLKKFDTIRKMVIPGKVTVDEYRQLQAGKSVDVLADAGNFLIKYGYAEKVDKAHKKAEVKHG